MSEHVPEQQSLFVVQAAPVAEQTRHLLSYAQVAPPQQGSPETQACSTGTHAAHELPSRQKPLQQSAVALHEPPWPEHAVHTLSWHRPPEQHCASVVHEPWPIGMHASQVWSSPEAGWPGAGVTQRRPLQHWPVELHDAPSSWQSRQTPPTQLPVQQSPSVPQPVALVGRHASHLPSAQNFAPAQQS